MSRKKIIKDLEPVEPVSLADLDAKQCAYPYPGGYCGRETIKHKPYCPGHCQVCYIKPREKRSDNEKEFHKDKKTR
jgi:hypothetical protein